MVDVFVLDKSVAEKPIRLPPHPYAAALRDFGLDELVAGGIDALSTTALNYALEDSMKKLVLPLAGPVIEKVGFFPIHFKKAWDVYRTMPKEKRKKLSHYFKHALSDGSANLMKDLLIHDPLYISFMLAGLNYAPEIHPGVLSAASYTTAVLIVAGIDVAKDEFLHNRKKKSFEKAGFGSETYYESRFYIKAEKDPQEVLEKIASEFNLEKTSTVDYHDRYYNTALPSYSGRSVKMRLRSRGRREFEGDNARWGDDPEFVTSAQIIYTRASEEKKDIDQCRYFPVKKEKLYFFLPKDATTIESIPDEKARTALLNAQDKSRAFNDIMFSRTVVRDGELAACTDKVGCERPFYIIELKTHKNVKMLQEAMRYVMVECPIAVIQTTHGKSDLFCNLNGRSG